MLRLFSHDVDVLPNVERQEDFAYRQKNTGNHVLDLLQVAYINVIEGKQRLSISPGSETTDRAPLH